MTTPHVVLTPCYAEAVQYASGLNGNQTCKSTNIVYISHLLDVSPLVPEVGEDEGMTIAAPLHDGPEDQGGQVTLDEIKFRFGDGVATVVKGCSDSLAGDSDHKAPTRERREEYLAHLKETEDDTLTLPLSDKLHDARAITTDLAFTGPSTCDSSKAPVEYSRWSYESIAAIRRANACLRADLAEAMAQIAALRILVAHQKDIARFELTFNAYERLLGHLGTIVEMLEPIQPVYQEIGKVPSQADYCCRVHTFHECGSRCTDEDNQRIDYGNSGEGV